MTNILVNHQLTG